jgi:hypothetical protein
MMETRTDKDRFDVVSFVIEYEAGELEQDDIVEGFQHLIDDGTVWHLQGSYGRQAARLIDAGLCTPPSEPRAEPKPEKVGSHCECGAGYVYLERVNRWGYACNR